MREPSKRRARGMVELTISTIMMLLVIAAAGAVLAYLGWYAYNQKQIADAQVELASLQAAGVLQGGKFAVVFNRPVTVVKIGYGYYNEQTGQEFGFQWMAVGKSGQAFQWDLGGSGYNATYVIADLGNGVYKVYRWHFVQITPQRAAQLSAAVASALSSGSPSSAAQLLASTNNGQPSSRYSGAGSANRNPTNPGVGNPGGSPGGADITVYVTVQDSPGVWWRIGSSADSVSGSGTVYNQPLEAIPGDTLVSLVGASGCSISPQWVFGVQAYGHYTFTVSCNGGGQPISRPGGRGGTSNSGGSNGGGQPSQSPTQSPVQQPSQSPTTNMTQPGGNNTNTGPIQPPGNSGPTSTNSSLSQYCEAHPFDQFCMQGQPSSSGGSTSQVNSSGYSISGYQPADYITGSMEQTTTIYVTVDDSPGAQWTISSTTSSISGSGTEYGQSMTAYVHDTLHASVNSLPGYSCTINPTSASVESGGWYTFTVSCTPITNSITTGVCTPSQQSPLSSSLSTGSLTGDMCPANPNWQQQLNQLNQQLGVNPTSPGTASSGGGSGSGGSVQQNSGGGSGQQPQSTTSTSNSGGGSSSSSGGQYTPAPPPDYQLSQGSGNNPSGSSGGSSSGPSTSTSTSSSSASNTANSNSSNSSNGSGGSPSVDTSESTGQVNTRASGGPGGNTNAGPKHYFE